MTAIEELRRLLDERGVEWRKWDYFGIDIGTIFNASGIEWIVIWDPKANNLSIANYRINHTAEQIIAATLGAPERTCHRAIKPNCMVCSECSYVLREDWKYCPNCRARIEVDHDARDLRDAIAVDDGRRYSMQEVMEMMEGGE